MFIAAWPKPVSNYLRADLPYPKRKWFFFKQIYTLVVVKISERQKQKKNSPFHSILVLLRISKQHKNFKDVDCMFSLKTKCSSFLCKMFSHDNNRTRISNFVMGLSCDDKWSWVIYSSGQHISCLRKWMNMF